MDFIDEEIGFNEAVYACDNSKVPLRGNEIARTVFANGRNSTLYGWLPFFITDHSDISFSGGNTFSLA